MRMTGILLACLAAASPALAQARVGLRPAAPERGEAIEWDRRSAYHLMRRAGFSASPREIDRLLEQGLQATLNELIDFRSVDDSEMERGLAERDYRLSRFNEQADREFANPIGLNQWWLYRMLHSKRQLLEKMTYFWHDHFATSIEEIRFVKPSTGRPLILIQQDTLREFALGNFKAMVHAMARDPAMLIWLDNFLNVANEPNENWARELLELFTMGVDQYSEEDIQEAARAFTGWTLDFDRRNPDRFDFEFAFVPILHDFGEKTFLGQTGPWDGDDIIDIIFEQEVTAEFISRKIWEFFVYPDPDEALVEELARVFRESGYETSVLMRAIFRHPEFFSERAYRGLMKSPVEAAVGFARELELDYPDVLPFFMFDMNQILFAPPDVGGWTSGVGWINTSTLLFRYNFFNTLIAVREPASQRRNRVDAVDLFGIIERFQLQTGEEVVDHFVERLLAGDASPDEKIVLEDYLRRRDDGTIGTFDISDPLTVDKKVRGLVYLVCLLPAYQLN